ncbi:MAG: alpha/beta hydrolase [Desulfatibacillum sp.]|nr:alpha/beta hydrolase [Desulfatibacillum sp.]
MKQTIPYHPERLTNSGNIEIAYDAFGDPQARPLLLIMGLADQMITWHEDLCRALAGRGFFVIRFDNRDIGASGKLENQGVPNIPLMMLKKLLGLPVQAPYDLSDMADDAVAVLDALNLKNAHVMGASMGGMIGQALALDHPERVRSLVSLISAPDLIPNLSILKGFTKDLADWATGRDSDFRTLSPSLAALQFLVKPVPTDREAFADFYTHLNLVVNGKGVPLSTRESREHAYELFERGLYPEGAVRQFAGILGSPDRNHRLKSLQTPTLVIHGAMDPLIPVRMGMETARLIPGARLKIIKNMGHWLPRPVWRELFQALEEFWDQEG